MAGGAGIGPVWPACGDAAEGEVVTAQRVGWQRPALEEPPWQGEGLGPDPMMGWELLSGSPQNAWESPLINNN